MSGKRILAQRHDPLVDAQVAASTPFTADDPRLDALSRLLSSEPILTFGLPEQGVTYRPRPGGYVLIVDATARLAVVRGASGLYLPGGGQEAGENPAEAARREAIEECGLEVELLHCLGVADELVYAPSEAQHFRKRCTFFAARVQRQRAEGGEHPLLWLPTAEAQQQLRHDSQRWALSRLFEFTSGGP